MEQLTGIIMLQTVVNVVKFAQGGVYRRLLNKIVRSVVFYLVILLSFGHLAGDRQKTFA